MATTVRRLQTERAGGDRVQFDGIVTGKYGHTFVPFSGASSGASSSVGDHNRFPYNDPFRIIVLAVRGSTLVFELDGNHRGLFSQDFLSDATRLIRTVKFPAA